MIRVVSDDVVFELESPEVYLTPVHVMGKGKYHGWYQGICPRVGEYADFPIHLERSIRDAVVWCKANGLVEKEVSHEED